MAPIF